MWIFRVKINLSYVALNLDADLTDLEVRLADGSITTIYTTPEHPFWDATLGAWINAGDLELGHLLRTAHGVPATLVASRTYAGTKWMHNLTIADIHTFYIIAGTTPILVHNTDAEDVCSIGRYAAESIPARSQGRAWTRAEIRLNNRNGDYFGCHTCGALTPGTKRGTWIKNHWPPSEWVSKGTRQRLFPQCATCSAKQGYWVRKLAPIMRRLWGS
jgi:hypothetical protein